MSSNAFAPQPTNTAAIASSSSASAGIQVKGSLANATQRMIYNAGPADAFLAWASSSGVVAAVPSSSAPANGTPIPAGAVMTLSFPPNAYFSAICGSTSGATVYLTPGEGN